MIPEDIVRRIREETELAALIGETIKLTRRGRSLIGLCPFHKEKTPSFHVNPERGRFYCFGCHAGGSAVDFVMLSEGLEFRDAIIRLGERLGIQVQDDGRQTSQPGDSRADLYNVNAVAARFYQDAIQNDTPGAAAARLELRKRGLGVDQGGPVQAALAAFQVGYAPAGWDGLTAHLTAQGISPLDGEKVGLLLPRKGGTGHYDRFRNRIMFAIHDVQGRVVGFSGRILPDPDTGVTDKTTGKYINSPESAIYRKTDQLFGIFQAKAEIKTSGCATIVEGNFDVVSLHAAGIRTAVASLGTALTTQQCKIIRRFAPKVTIAFDGDNAGRAATAKALVPTVDSGLDARVAVLPNDWDPDSFVRDCGPEAMQELLLEPRGLIEHLIDQHLSTFESGSVQDRVARVRDVAALLGSISDETVREMATAYADGEIVRVSKGKHQSFAAVRQAAQRTSRTQQQKQPAPQNKPISEDVALGLRMLGCLIDHPEIVSYESVASAVALLDGDIALCACRVPVLAKQGADEFLAVTPPRLNAFVSKRLAAPRYDDAHVAMDTIRMCATKLVPIHRRAEREALQRDLASARETGDAVAEAYLVRRITELNNATIRHVT